MRTVAETGESVDDSSRDWKPVQEVKKKIHMIIFGELKDKTSCIVLNSLEFFSEFLWDPDAR